MAGQRLVGIGARQLDTRVAAVAVTGGGVRVLALVLAASATWPASAAAAPAGLAVLALEACRQGSAEKTGLGVCDTLGACARAAGATPAGCGLRVGLSLVGLVA